MRARFTLRFLLVAVTIAAAGLGAGTYFYEPPIRPITVEQVKCVKIGMSRQQVRAILGSPLKGPDPNPPKWLFHYANTSGEDFVVNTLEVWFDSQGKVKEVRDQRYITWSVDA